MNPLRRLFLSFLFLGTPLARSKDATGAKPGKAEANALLDRFHKAAAKAHFGDYFSCLSEDAVFLGTDAKERWPVPQFKEFVKPYFEKGTGWSYEKIDRHILVSRDGQHASFDELLNHISVDGKTDNSYGLCRGSGVLRQVDGRWKIEQYHLTIPIPNELAKEVAQRIRKK